MTDTNAPRPRRSQERLTRVRERMKQKHIDALYCRDISNVRWLTDFDEVFDSEDAHLALITAKDSILHTDTRYIDAAQRAAENTSWRVDATPSAHAVWAANAIEGRFAEKSLLVSCLGIEGSMALAEFRRVEEAFDALRPTPEIIETSDFVRELRAVKDETEIAAMRAAQDITDRAFDHIVDFMRKRLAACTPDKGIAGDASSGLTEREVQLELEQTMRLMGAEDVAFSSIVASGPNAAAPHSIPGKRCLAPGDMVVIDFGARKDGYCSDMTRTVCIGHATEEAQRVFAAVRAANEAVEAILRPGITGKEAHELAEQVLAKHGFADKMGHGLGHGVGIDIHELPVLSLRNPNPLKPGHVVTVEPGVYLPGVLGCRLEDFGVITETGFEVFTRSTHELVII